MGGKCGRDKREEDRRWEEIGQGGEDRMGGEGKQGTKALTDPKALKPSGQHSEGRLYLFLL